MASGDRWARVNGHRDVNVLEELATLPLVALSHSVLEAQEHSSRKSASQIVAVLPRRNWNELFHARWSFPGLCPAVASLERRETKKTATQISAPKTNDIHPRPLNASTSHCGVRSVPPSVRMSNQKRPLPRSVNPLPSRRKYPRGPGERPGTEGTSSPPLEEQEEEGLGLRATLGKFSMRIIFYFCFRGRRGVG